MSQASSPWNLLARLRRRLRRLIWWSGISQFLLALLGGLLLAGWLDWWWKLDDLGTRLLLAGAVWGLAAWTAWRVLWKPLRRELSDVFLAEQIDRLYPGLSARLTSAAEFRSSQFDPRHGSSELQELVVQQAAADLQQVKPDQLLNPRKISPQVAGALVACLLAAGVLYARPLEAATAMRRMAWPFGNIPWPRSTVLQLRTTDGQPVPWDPRSAMTIVRGETLELLVENLRGNLPHDLTLLVREPGQELPEEIPLRPRVRRDEARREDGTTVRTDRAPLQLPVTRDLVEFRVVGGDDRYLPWYALAAVDPPRLTSASIQVTPPTYTGAPTVTLPTGSTQVRGWLGSKVRVTAQADRDVKSIELRVGDKPSVSIPVGDDKRSWSAELEIDRPAVTHFSFVLRDDRGFAEPQPMQFELRGEIDTLPEVILTEPAADQWVTPEAVVPIAAEARDDLGLTKLQRSMQRGNQSPQIETLQEFPDRPRQARLETEWPLSDLQLQPGERIVLRIEGVDACDIGDPHIGRSAPRTLLVVSAEEKRRELTDRISEIVDELRDAISQQKRLSEQAEELQTQLRDVGTLQSQDRDLLNRLQWDQRRLAAHLSDELRGMSRRAQQLREEFPANQIKDAEAEPHLEQLAQELRDLGDTTFPAIDRELTRITKALDGTVDPAEESPRKDAAVSATDSKNSTPSKDDTTPRGAAAAEPALRQMSRLQEEAVRTLTERHADLSRWQNDRHLGDDLESLAESQAKLNQAAAELGAQTLSKSLPELSPQQRADLNKLADRQRQVSQRVEQVQREFSGLSERLEDNDPLRAAEALDLADQLKNEQLATRLRQAADDLAANRLGAAGDVQQQAGQTLQRLVEQWTSARPDDSEQLLKRTEAAEQMAKSLGDEVEQMRKRTDPDQLSQASQEERDELMERAQELRRRAERLERELQRLRLRRGAEAARQAARRLRAAQQALQDGDDAAAAEEMAAAEAAVEELQQELSAARKEVADRLAQEEIERVIGTLQSLKTRQDQVITETQRLETERQGSGRLTRGQLRSLQELAAVERELQQMAEQARDQLQQAVVAHSALQSVARSLGRAAERLSERQTDAVTIMLERDASKRLERMIAAWQRQNEPQKPESDEQPEPMPEGDAGDEPEQAGPQGEAMPWRLQLLLLRELQADFLERTLAFEALRDDDGELSADLLPLLEDLAEEQGSLIDLATQLAELYRQSQAAANAAIEAADGVPEPKQTEESLP